MSSGRGGNLVKSFFLAREGIEPRVIDTNRIIEEKLNILRNNMPSSAYSEDYSDDQYYNEPGFEGGLDAQTLDALVGDGSSYDDMGMDEGGEPYSNVIKAEPSDGDGMFAPISPEVIHKEPVYDGPSPEELILQAEAEIENMKQAAYNEIEQQKAMGYEEGKAQGYNDGKAMADAEIADQLAAIEQERAGLMQQYEELAADLEPRFVHTLTSIYEKIFDVDLSSHRELILGLLKNAFSHIDRSKNYLIHVSPDDHPYVTEHKEELLESLGNTADVVIDIVEDITMKRNDCMIETPDGIFDCSLDTELASLRKKLELLSYTPD